MSPGAVTSAAARLARRARGRAGPALDLVDIQGNVLRPYDNDHAAYLFVELEDPASARRLLLELEPHVTPATEWVVPPVVTTNVAFSAAGLRALGVAEAQVDSFPVAFREGMAARAAQLGDEGPQGPEHWDPGLRDDTAHLLVALTAWSGDRLDERAEELAVRIEHDDGLRLAHCQRAERFDDRREHFGFLDGVAQPKLDGIDPDGTPPMGTPVRDGWRALAIGEFVLGRRDAEGVVPPVPAEGWAANGSYLVVRKLHQDVAAFRRLVRETGGDYPGAGGPDELAAKIVGRWADGTPLTLSPRHPDPAIAGDPGRVNRFKFDVDPVGSGCPLGAHIRRVNPRDSAGVGGAMTTRHRLLRRGLPYGPRLLPGEALADDGVDRGLVFTCFVADIQRQFEFVVKRWVNDGDLLRAGHDPDPLIGTPRPGSKLKVPGAPGEPPYFLALDEPLVRLRGGAYLFQPGVRALGRIARGPI
jgi:Dyp-type peroxidase family